MKITFDQTQEDLIDYSHYYSWRSPDMTGRRRSRPFIPLLIFMVIIFDQKGFRWQHYGVPEYLLLSFGLLIAGSYGWLVRLSSTRMVRKLIAAGKNANMLGNKTLILEEHGLVAVTPTSRSEISWTAFEKFAETPERFFLFLHVNQAFVIPKKAFENHLQVDTFRNLIAQNIRQQ